MACVILQKKNQRKLFICSTTVIVFRCGFNSIGRWIFQSLNGLPGLSLSLPWFCLFLPIIYFFQLYSINTGRDQEWPSPNFNKESSHQMGKKLSYKNQLEILECGFCKQTVPGCSSLLVTVLTVLSRKLMYSKIKTKSSDASWIISDSVRAYKKWADCS